ncbi:VanZ family protein [Knoellia sp. LjRoot47]|uniref:VanZ family protein n=1 Tax=Knoellia sp. LjRoot47 TaxID=3342330 RepID=UPI003ECD81C6
MSEALRRRRSLVPAALALLLQLVVLYAPSAGGVAPFPYFDKLVHLTVFALPVLFAVLARLPVVPVAVVMALHAPVSEVVQATVLPQRSGDPWDAVADVTGVLLGVLVARYVGSVRSPGREADHRRGR